MAKTKTKAEKKHLSDVAALGCIACRINGDIGTPAEIHHIRSGQGFGQRAGHFDVIPLCPIHHRTGGYGEPGFHQNRALFIEKFGDESRLLEMVNDLLKTRWVGCEF